MADSYEKALPESFAKPLVVGMMVSNAKFEVEEFDGTNNFGMWQCEVMDVLVQHELDITFEDKPEGMLGKDWERLIDKLVAPFVCVWPRMLFLVVTW